ncbi:MAG TPA: pilus assembly protein PilM, partial [Magnetococcales bacterium]|nr:pilus assembly protein PilM [Magnetococcales bacterium]
NTLPKEKTKGAKKGTKNASASKEASPTKGIGSAATAGEKAETIVAFANIGSQTLNTLILVGGIIDYSRDVSFGAKSMIAEIIEQTGLTMEEVQSALQKPAHQSTTPQLGEAWENTVKPFEEKLASQIRQSIDFFQSSRPSKDKIQTILLSGGVAAIAGIEQRLGQDLGVPVEIFNPVLKLGNDGKTPAPSAGQAPGFTVSLGLALRGVSS